MMMMMMMMIVGITNARGLSGTHGRAGYRAAHEWVFALKIRRYPSRACSNPPVGGPCPPLMMYLMMMMKMVMMMLMMKMVMMMVMMLLMILFVVLAAEKINFESAQEDG
jgi:hypothetical protein